MKKFVIQNFLQGWLSQLMGGGQNLERRNVERPVFRDFEIANIKMKKNELFDNFIFELFTIFEHLKYLIIFDIVKY